MEAPWFFFCLIWRCHWDFGPRTFSFQTNALSLCYLSLNGGLHCGTDCLCEEQERDYKAPGRERYAWSWHRFCLPWAAFPESGSSTQNEWQVLKETPEGGCFGMNGLHSGHKKMRSLCFQMSCASFGLNGTAYIFQEEVSFPLGELCPFGKQ